MRIVFTSEGKDWDSKIDPRFGRARFLILFDEETGELTAIENMKAEELDHGAGTATTKTVAGLKPDLVITGNGPGATASAALKHLNIKILVGAHNLTLRHAYEQYEFGLLQEH